MKTFLSLFLSALLAIGAISFNGTTTTALSGTNAAMVGLSSWTFCAWVYPVGLGESDRGRIMHWEGDALGQTRFLITFLTTGSIRAEVGTNATSRSADSQTTLVSLNTWQHVCASYTASDGGPRIFYGTASTDSAEISYLARTDGSGATWADTNIRMAIGNNRAEDRTWNGRIAEAFFFGRVLTSTERNTLRLGYPVAGAVGIWALYQNNTSTGVDTSGNGINLTMANTAAADHAPIAPAFGWWR